MACYLFAWCRSRASRSPRIACNSTAASPSVTPSRSVDYLRELGVSDCYASSYLKAVPGSPHGYDVADPTRLNPEIGTDEEYWAWIDALHARGMGHVLDLVPNHMGIAKSANPWWMDVLENGPSSRFARFFDIEWRPVKDELADKVLIPILGDQYGAVLERQELQLAYRDGAFIVHYYDNWLPIAPDTFGTDPRHGLDVGGSRRSALGAADVDELRSILTAAGNLPSRATRDAGGNRRSRPREGNRQAAPAALLDAAPASVADRRDARRLQRRRRGAAQLRSARRAARTRSRIAWRTGGSRRRKSTTGASSTSTSWPRCAWKIRRCSTRCTGSPSSWSRRGAATGLRVDHVDGLYAPGDYLRRLQARAAEALGGEPRRSRIYVVVEKILGPDEQLAERLAGARHDRLRIRRHRQRPVRRPPARARDGRRLPRFVRGRRRRRSTTSSTAARSRCCTRPCRATSTRSATG